MRLTVIVPSPFVPGPAAFGGLTPDGGHAKPRTTSNLDGTFHVNDPRTPCGSPPPRPRPRGAGGGADLAGRPDTPAAPTPTPVTPTPPAAGGAAPAPNDLSLGTTADENGPGTTYTKDTFGDWQERCVRTQDGKDPCQMYQLLKDGQGNNVAEVSMFGLPAGQQAAAGATVVAPLETLLTQQLTLKVDTGTPKQYPFTWCSQVGCISRIGFTGPEVDAFKRGSKAEITIVPVAAPDQAVVLAVSLKGFTAAYDAVNANNAANGN